MQYIVFVIMAAAIPVDFVLWNLMFGQTYGYRTLKQCAYDGYVVWLKEYRR